MASEAAADSPAETTIDRLIQAGVIEPVNDGDELRLSPDLEDRIQEHAEAIPDLDEDTLTDTLAEATGHEAEAAALVEVAEDHEEIIAEYLALTEYDELTHEDRLQAMTLLDPLRDSPPPAEGAPDAFIPVHGNRLPFLVRVHKKAIVYLWTEDCPPCDTVKEDFNEVIDPPLEGIALFAVYGPDASPLLYEKYQAVTAPTILFFLNGKVDCRLLGAQYPRVYERQIEILQELD